ncbi:MAG: hypothetical protein Q9216_005469 [Gyalolechia sp. 2 TL-2023]
MSDQDETSHHTNNQNDHTSSLTHKLSSECPEPLQPLPEALPPSYPSHSESGWTLVEPDLSLHPAVTTPPSHHITGIQQASPTSANTTQVEVPSHQLPKLKRRRSFVSSPQAHAPPSVKTEPTASQIALRQELDRQDLELRELARKRAADEGSDSDKDNISRSCSESDSSQLDMTTGPEYVRKELKKDFMFIDSGHLNDSENAGFKKMVTKVMETDRTSAVSGEDMERFKRNYKTYKDSNEATLVHALLPIMMGDKFTAQDVNEESQGEGDYKERSFIEQGVVYMMDHLFNRRYCLPNRFMNVSPLPESTLKSLFDSKAHLTTPKPDFVYGLSEDKLPSPPSDIVPSDRLDALLNLAPIREVFFVWENKSGGGNLIKCGNDALKDTSALVHARRQIYELMGRAKGPGIDKDTYIYAAINNNQKIEFYVAYAWLPQDLSRVEFCMDMIGSEDFTINELQDNRNILPCLRKPLHNIIEWGSVTRIPKLVQLYERLWIVERARFAKSMKEDIEREAEARNSKKKQKISH